MSQQNNIKQIQKQIQNQFQKQSQKPNDYQPQGRPKNAVSYARYKELEVQFCAHMEKKDDEIARLNAEIARLKEENLKLSNRDYHCGCCASLRTFYQMTYIKPTPFKINYKIEM